MENRRQNTQGGLVGGIVLIAIGSLFLLDRMRILDFDFGDIVRTWWPMFMIIPGVIMALDSHCRNKNGAFFMIAFGLIFQIAELDLFRWWRWRNLWPLMMIAIGVWMLFQHLQGRNESAPGSSPGGSSAPSQLP